MFQGYYENDAQFTVWKRSLPHFKISFAATKFQGFTDYILLGIRYCCIELMNRYDR